MHQAKKWWASNFVVLLVAGFSIATMVALSYNKIAGSNTNFSLTYNVFALISFVSAFIDLLIVVLLTAKRRYSITTNWFLLFAGAAAIAAIAEGLQRSSIHPEAAIFWQNFAYMGYALLPPTFYLFIVSYTSHYKQRFIFLSSVLILAWGIIAFFCGEGLLFKHAADQINHAPWGYFSANSNVTGVVIAWFAAFYIFGIGLLLQFRKATQNRLIKKQAMTFILAFLMPFVAAFTTNILLPDVRPNIVPPLATFFGSISGIIVYFGIRKYHIFDVDPQLLAQDILDTMSEAVIITRPDMSIESINPEAERLLGVGSKKAGELKLQSLFSDNSWQQILDKIEHGQRQKSDRTISKSVIKNVHNKSIPVRVTATTLVDAGEKLANIIVLSDISELTKSFDALQNSAAHIYHQNDMLKKLETQLEADKASIEHIVDLRTKELRNAQSKLKAADQLKTEFVILSSHNLRTPLTIARGYAQMISDLHLPTDKKVLVDELISGLDRLDDFVEDLLSITLIESGDQLILEEVPFSGIIKPLINELKNLARTRNDKVVINLDNDNVKVKADAKRLQGALRNVINNACKFTEDGTIELSTSRSDNKLVIKVSDTGIGIAKDEMPKLFTKFHKATSVLNSGSEGEGVGLYLTKLIVEEHGGKISCVSEINKGTTFSIELPC